MTDNYDSSDVMCISTIPDISAESIAEDDNNELQNGVMLCRSMMTLH